MVRVLRPTSSTDPSGAWRMTTSEASQARRCDVSAETYVAPSSNSRTASPVSYAIRGEASPWRAECKAMGTGEAAVVPAGVVVELAQQHKKLVGGRMQTSGQRGDGFSEVRNVALTFKRRPIIANRFSGDEGARCRHIAS